MLLVKLLIDYLIFLFYCLIVLYLPYFSLIYLIYYMKIYDFAIKKLLLKTFFYNC